MRGRVCLVTSEFHGLFRNGGIGTANTGLATTLAASGFDVTVVFLADASVPEADLAAQRAVCRRLGVTLEDLRPAAEPRAASLAVYHTLRARRFDAVYFNDSGGHGFYALQAKRTGVWPDAPRLCVVAHGPLDWVDGLNATRTGGMAQIATAFMERRCVACADQLVSPSRYLLDWMRAQGWELPAGTLVLQNIVPLPDGLRPLSSRPMPTGADADAPSVIPATAGIQATPRTARASRLDARPSGHDAAWAGVLQEASGPATPFSPPHVGGVGGGVGPPPTRELVFFGRLERRKGLETYCDALDLLAEQGALSPVALTFLGKFGAIDGVHAGALVLERSARWHRPLRLMARLGQDAALRHLARPGVVAVVPSLAENSPCVVAECLRLGIPLVASDRGGTAELVHPEDRAACLVAPDAVSLAAALRHAIADGCRPARPHVDSEGIRRAWCDLTAAFIARRDDGVPDAAGTPPVSVCLSDDLAPDTRARLLQATEAQTYRPLEIIVATDEAAAMPRAGGGGRLRVVATGGAAPRAAAVAHARGDFVFLCDEARAMPEPDCIAALMTAAARTGADVVTVADGASPALGACCEIGLIENGFGQDGVLIARSALAACGDVDDAGGRLPLWPLLARAIAAGLRLEPVPAPLLRHDASPPAVADAARRAVRHAFRDQTLAGFGRLLDLLPAPIAAPASGLPDGLDHEARLRLAALSRHDPNAPAALDGLADYALLRGRVAEALAFATDNDIALSPEGVDEARLPRPEGHRLPPEVLARVESVSDTLRRTLSPGGSLLLHPRHAATVLARLPAAIPAGATGLRAVVSLEHARSHPVQFAFWLRDPHASAASEADFVPTDPASGWFPAGTPFRRVSRTTRFAAPLPTSHDLYLATRVIGYPDVHFCHAHWQEVWVLG